VPSEFRRGLPGGDGETVVPEPRPVRRAAKRKARVIVPSRFDFGRRTGHVKPPGFVVDPRVEAKHSGEGSRPPKAR
jgi:hypothetical protein